MSFSTLNLSKTQMCLNTILLTDIEIMPLNIQNLLLSVKSKNASSLLISNKTKFIATSSKNMKQILK